ncbi:hypothetical protein BIFGAL_04067 [Bifidobacterium gallicum DSM 20093 = LMG 11596]|uniref:Uncharacterized protein n=1 Tax=Bifidobacterium gallicum DSM 20093 = LMG 11596 TaxID=561180 RepID=D1NW22_9BIFI|nr:hypothetical protein BIFGAL_04067 [Bifidobacterium gallicum DSM 20093 = LMG 11596]
MGRISVPVVRRWSWVLLAWIGHWQSLASAPLSVHGSSCILRPWPVQPDEQFATAAITPRSTPPV